MINLITIDNNCGQSFSLDTDVYDTLSISANKPLSELKKDNKQLLIFPNTLGHHEDGIADKPIFHLWKNQDENAEKATITTGNLMGFVGIRRKGNPDETKSVYLTIRSRFSSGDNDYFMQYMLQKVFAINLFDYKFTTGKDAIFNLMLFLFPYMLKKAMRQGIFRTYRTFRRNDANIKGTIDISRHIRMNIPFAGRIAYNSRERTPDNPIMQLIRHTIEEIKASRFGKSVLNCGEDMRGNVKDIIESTPSYSRLDREKVIRQNIRPFSHPYFTEYKPLQKLCLNILRHKKISFSQSDKDEVYGILFDGAWLWEEYLNTVLNKCGFNHAKNKATSNKNGISVYIENNYKLYPDFYRKLGEDASQNAILDAKYKRVDGNGISPEDLHQLIAYIHILPACKGGLIYPLDNGEKFVIENKSLYGYGGQIFTVGIPIPKAKDFKTFCEGMNKTETELTEQARNNFSSQK